MCGIEFPVDSNLLVGLDRADDAGVYKVTDDIAIIQTVDFFTPIVDDPYRFGQIAAANALSDVYAMGGIPKTAMNLVAFPLKDMDISVLREIIQGGLDKLKEADVVLLGGHSVEDKELKYGLSVTGFIHPDKILTKKGFTPGNLLILTKPLGTGVINTAIKGGIASQEVIERVTGLMTSLNRDAAEIMKRYRVNACTDITGFGLIGHLAEMVTDSGAGMRLEISKIPLIKGALDYASMGLFPAGAYKNREFRGPFARFESSVSPVLQDLLFDPQTSGGLLVCIEEEDAEKMIFDLEKTGNRDAAIIGEVVRSGEEKIFIE